jgi:predicted DNA-binding ribbon-helix-helix protein
VRNGISFVESEQPWFKLNVVKSRLFVLDGLDMRMVDPRPKSIRLDGMSTCVRLEELYWAILKSMAECNRTTINTLLTALDRDVQMEVGGVKNFSSLIRVMSTVQLLKMCPEGVKLSVMENLG